MATTQASVLAEGFDKIPQEYAKEFIAWLKKNNFFRKFFTAPAAYGTADARERDLLRSWKRTRANEFLAEIAWIEKKQTFRDLTDERAKEILDRPADFLASLLKDKA